MKVNRPKTSKQASQLHSWRYWVMEKRKGFQIVPFLPSLHHSFSKGQYWGVILADFWRTSFSMCLFDVKGKLIRLMSYSLSHSAKSISDFGDEWLFHILIPCSSLVIFTSKVLQRLLFFFYLQGGKSKRMWGYVRIFKILNDCGRQHT